MIRPTRKPNGRYAVRWRENGHQRQQTFDRRTVADAFATRLNDRLQSHGLVDLDRGKTPLAVFVERYWVDYAVPNLTPNTRAAYAQVWGKHLLPRIGALPLRDLTPKRLTQLRVAMARAGVGDPTILKAFTMLQSVLSHAVVEEELERNPAREVRKPSQERHRDIVIATPEQIEAIRGNLDQRSATIVSLLAYAGLRTFSELHGLEWRHVGDRGLQVWAPKTRRFDVVTLLRPLAQDLAEWRMASGRPGERSPVVPRRDGLPLRDTDWRNWRRRVFRPAAEAVGLPAMHPYACRHAFASLLIWEGRSLADVASQMRHSVQTCSTNYIAVLEEFHLDRRESAEDRIRRARGAAPARRIGGTR